MEMGAREQPGPILGPTPAVRLLLEGELCRCDLCLDFHSGGRDPASLLLVSFPLPPSNLTPTNREDLCCGLIWALRPFMNGGGVVRLALSAALEAGQGTNVL